MRVNSPNPTDAPTPGLMHPGVESILISPVLRGAGPSIEAGLQGYLAHKKERPRRTLQYQCGFGPPNPGINPGGNGLMHFCMYRLSYILGRGVQGLVLRAWVLGTRD